MKSFGSSFNQRRTPLSASTGFSRRQFMQLAAVAGGATLLSACSTNPAGSAPGATGAGPADELIWANWPLSVDTEDDGTIGQIHATVGMTVSSGHLLLAITD